MSVLHHAHVRPGANAGGSGSTANAANAAGAGASSGSGSTGHGPECKFFYRGSDRELTFAATTILHEP